MRKTKKMNNLAALVVTIILLIIAWFSFDAFFGLVGSIYDFLDMHIWAFFAGIIAFIFAITLVVLMIKIAIISVAAFIFLMVFLLQLFK